MLEQNVEILEQQLHLDQEASCQEGVIPREEVDNLVAVEHMVVEVGDVQLAQGLHIDEEQADQQSSHHFAKVRFAEGETNYQSSESLFIKKKDKIRTLYPD